MAASQLGLRLAKWAGQVCSTALGVRPRAPVQPKPWKRYSNTRIASGAAELGPRSHFVTKLDDAILRMVDIEMTGADREPDASEVIRTGGDPQDGACEVASGMVVKACWGACVRSG